MPERDIARARRQAQATTRSAADDQRKERLALARADRDRRRREQADRERQVRENERVRRENAKRDRDQRELQRHGFAGASRREMARRDRDALARAAEKGGSAKRGEPILRPGPTREEAFDRLVLQAEQRRDPLKQAAFKIPGVERVATETRAVADMFANAPGGIVALGRAAAEDVRDRARTGEWDPRKGGERSGELLEEIVRGTGELYADPLKEGHTGPAIVTTLPAISAVGRLAAAGRAAGQAARAGEGVGGAARAAVRRPKPGQAFGPDRTFEYEGLEVPGIYSRIPAVEAIQRLSDAVRRRRPGLGFSTGPAATRNLPARVGFELAENRRVLDAREAAPALGLAKETKLSKRPRKRHRQQVEQTAARVEFEGATVADRIRFHEERAAAATSSVQRRRHERKIALLRRAETLLEDTPGGPQVALTNERLRELMARARDVERSTTASRLERGALLPEQASFRVQAPGRVIGGARYERTPAVKGRAEQIREYPGRSKTVTRPRTRDEAKTRLAELDKHYAEIVGALADRLNPYADQKAMRAEQLYRNRTKGRRARGRAQEGRGAGQARRKTVKEEVHDLAEEQLSELIARNPEHPVSQRAAALIAERDQIRRALNEEAEAAFDLAPEQVAQRAEKLVDRQMPELLRRYEQQHDNLIDVDLMREQFPDYRGAPGRYAQAVHEPASTATKAYYEARLAREPAHDRTVHFTAGGTGAGKTRAVGGATRDADLIYDGTLKTFASAAEKIDQALASGRSAVVHYVYREPGDAVRAALSRERQPPTLDEFVKAHVGSRETIEKLVKRYESDDRVAFKLNVNPAEGPTRPVTFADVPRKGYSEVADEVRAAVEAEHAAGRVSDAAHGSFLASARGAEGQGARAGGGEGRRADARESGQGASAEAPRLGAVTETIPGKSRKVHLREIQAEPARKGLRGADDFDQGKTRVPYTAPFERTSIGRLSLGSGKVIGNIREIVKGPFKGGRLLSGNFRDDALFLIAEDAIRESQHTSRLRFRDQLLKASTEEKRGRHQVALRVSTARDHRLTERLHDTLADYAEGIEPTNRGVRRMLETDPFKQVREALFPDTIDGVPVAEIAAGTKVEGIRWVDGRLLEGVNRPPMLIGAADNPLYRGMLATNNGMRLAIFYTAPKYAPPNLLGQAALNFIQQGVHTPRNWKAGVRAHSKLGRDVVPVVDQAMGSGIGEAILSGGGKGLLGGTTQKAAELWSVVLDRMFRRTAWIHEARAAGFKSSGDMRRLVTDPTLETDFVRVTRRARREILDYQRLGRFEQALSQFLFIYPFTKASTVYFGHFLLEHPAKAAAIAGLGRAGQEELRRVLGDVPSFMRGVVPLKGDDGSVRVSSPMAFSPIDPGLAVAETVGSFLAGEPQRDELLTSYLHPGIRAGLSAAQRYDPFFGRELPSEPSTPELFVDELTGQTPQRRLVEGLRSPKAGRADVLYPETRGDAIRKFVFGTISPRPVNPDVVRQRAGEEARSLLTPEQRVYRRVFGDRNEWFATIKAKAPDALVAGRLAPPIRDAFNRKAAVEVARARAERAHPVGPDRERAKYQAEVRLLHEWGRVDAATVKDLLGWSRTADEATLRKARQAIGDSDFTALYLGTLRAARDAFAESGIDLP